MTPRTRNSNNDANFKVYYSKKVPQQAHFPHKRKTVRRPSELVIDGAEKRQIKFLPGKLRVRRGGEDDAEEDEEDGGVAIGAEVEDVTVGDTAGRGKTAKSRGKKRNSGVMDVDPESDDEKAAGPTPKRRRKSPAPMSNRRSKQIKPKPEPEDEDNTTPASEKKVDRARTIRRQSTMTQLVEGRRPLSDTEEPTFKPVKRNSRRSWSGQDKKEKDKKQRTLTQMIPGMKPLEIMSDEDMEEGLSDAEAEERESQLYGEAIAARLAQEGLMQNKSDDVEELDKDIETPIDVLAKEQNMEDKAANLDAGSVTVPPLVMRSVEDSMDEADEESYQPTQFIDAPNTRRRSPRKRLGVAQQALRTTDTPPATLRKKDKSRFGLLSTPEKRRVYEIASSQSPPDSPLSTQVSPSKAHRSPLKERSGNTAQVAETPLRRKQVTFQEPQHEPVPPPTLRKFESTIQDSEDENDDDDLLDANENDGGSHVGEHTQALIRGIDNAEQGHLIGTETQAILDQIDQACLPADDEDGAWPTRESSGEPIVSMFQNLDEASQELGEQPHQDIIQQQDSADVHSLYRAAHVGIKHEGSPELGDATQYQDDMREEHSPLVHSPYHTVHAGVKQEQFHEVQMLDLTGTYVSLEADVPTLENIEPGSIDSELPEESEQLPSSPPIIQPRAEDTCPSTPMVIMDSDDDASSDNEPDPTPPRPSPHPIFAPLSTAPQHSADLNTDLIQVPRSPHTTQQSHSSKAELQLHNEWFSYSQYVGARAPHSSSMHVAPDKFSYHATPMPPRPVTQQQNYMSQATTVDEVTPRKNRTQRRSANTTPCKLTSSQPLSSPVKPPPLFIPSSFPSPSRARVEEWSSPMGFRTQDLYAGGSLEDFSIPLPPPVEDDWMDGV
jgi:hypothetical protein